ncbi:para-nitrobenzyl esterase [Promicromonospora sp. AC04]|uniref:carboxylesterase/lipase family protein n=1 Tax=Promicromonospora sp. AC04 TaxID=2135723 RepID=UPI000D4A63BD|nr:carboxylesterase family protein [Promicromonospora sp. AC04]PUB32304.1 para-nitrobenzyl esterase [Promicromonospora sp. AC04]
MRPSRIRNVAGGAVLAAIMTVTLAQAPAGPNAGSATEQAATVQAGSGQHTERDGRPVSTVVSTESGKVRGEAGAMVTSYEGIPYAAPPVDDLRWRSPQPVEAWRGVRDATAPGPSCVQGSGWDPGYEEPTLTEDCLYLNVHRPSTADRRLPVFVWIHGGGNTGGAGSDTDPAKFVSRSDVVYVTVNYRLGAMGYLDTPALEASNDDDGSTGNFGILDQQAALRWVQDNIAAFGGDPRAVTIGGQSAGASNTCVHLSAPGSQGLFDRAIMQSGSCSARTPDAAQSSGEALAAVLGCPDTDAQVACLRGASAAEVLAAQQEVRQSGAVAGNAVLPTDPAELLATGRLADVPVLLGATSDESQQSVFATYDYVDDPLTVDGLYDLITERFDEHADAVREAYPADDYASPTVAWGDVLSDQRACRDQNIRDAMAAGNRTYTYEFAEQDGPPFTSIWRLGTDYPFGATHVNDLGYLWDYLGTALPFSADQVRLSDQMISYWSSFITTGEPDVRTAPAWPRYRPGGQVMQLTAPSGHVVDSAAIDAAHGCDLWDEVGTTS